MVSVTIEILFSEWIDSILPHKLKSVQDTILCTLSLDRINVKFTLDNIETLVNQVIMHPDSLDTRAKTYPTE